MLLSYWRHPTFSLFWDGNKSLLVKIAILSNWWVPTYIFWSSEQWLSLPFISFSILRNRTQFPTNERSSFFDNILWDRYHDADLNKLATLQIFITNDLNETKVGDNPWLSTSCNSFSTLRTWISNISSSTNTTNQRTQRSYLHATSSQPEPNRLQ